MGGVRVCTHHRSPDKDSEKLSLAEDAWAARTLLSTPYLRKVSSPFAYVDYLYGAHLLRL